MPHAWGPAAQTNRDADLIFGEDGSITPLELMLAPEDPRVPDGQPGLKEVHGAFVSAADRSVAGDVAITQTDWSLGMGFGLQDRNGKGGYSWGVDVDARFPRGVLPAGKKTEVALPTSGWTHAPIRGFAEYGSHIYAVTGADSITPAATSAILRIPGGVIANTLVSGKYPSDTAPYFCGRSIIQYNNYLWIGGFNGFMRRRLTTPGSPDVAPLDDTVPGDGSGYQGYAFQRIFLAKQHWKVAGIMDYYLVASSSAEAWVYTAGDPSVSGDWSSATGTYQDDPTAATKIGDGYANITGAAWSNRIVAWGKTDGVYQSDSTGYTPNLVPSIGDAYDSHNVEAIFYHDGYIWYGMPSGLYRIGTQDRVRVDVPEYVTPGFGRPAEGPIYGRVTAITEVSGWLVIAVYNGSDSFVLYGKDPKYLGLDVQVPMIWHGSMATFPGKRVTAFGKSVLTSLPLLYCGLWDDTTSTASLATVNILKASTAYQAWQDRNKPSGSQYAFANRFSLYATVEDLSLPNTQKTLLRGDVVSENLSSTRTLEVYTSMDGLTYSEAASSGDPYWVFTPPLSDDFVATIYGYGTSGSIDADASNATIQAALEAIHVDLVNNVSVTDHGTQTLKVTLTNLPTNAILSVDNGTLAFHLQGTIKTSPRQAFLPSSMTPNGYLVQARIDGTGSDSEPPILRGLQLRVSLIEDQLEEKICKVRFGHGIVNRRGTEDQADPLAKLSRFLSLMRQAPVQLTDEFGRSMTVKVEQGISYRQLEADGAWAFEVTFKYKIQKQPFYWNTGALWSDRFTWS